MYFFYKNLTCIIHEGETVIEKVGDFKIETGLFDSFKFGADCFLFTTNTRLPLQFARDHSTPGITRNFAVSYGKLWQPEPYGESLMNDAG